MSIQSKIENLRQKPEHVRKNIAFWTSFGITAVIFVFWIASMTSLGNQTQQAVAHAVKQAGTPAQSLTASVGSLFTDVKDLFFKPRIVNYSDIIVKPGK